MILDWSNGNQYFSHEFWDCWAGSTYTATDLGGRPAKKVKRYDDYARERRDAIMRDDREIMELAAIIVGSGILD